MLVELVLLAITLNGGYCYGDYDYDPNIGGQPATIEEFPSMVYIDIYMWDSVKQTLKKYFCAGTLIAPSWALTAARCFLHDGLVAIKMAARAGSANKYKGGEVRKVVRSAIGEVYDQTINGDIALMKVSPSFILNSHTIAATSLPLFNQKVYPGNTGVTVGWGKTSETNTTTDTLRKVAMKVRKHEECFTEKPVTPEMIDRYICAVSQINPTEPTAYRGDSGGPLYSDTEIIGVLSSESRDPTNGYNVIFFKVSIYRDWIRNITGV